MDTGEACDSGPQNSDEVPDACRTDCTLARCGDGVVDVQAGEGCDCGDATGIVAPGCVAGNGAPGGTCTEGCHTLYCGNGVLDPGEVCDDGNNISGDGCSANCLSGETCGNGITDFAKGEGCDCGTDVSHLPTGCTGTNSDAPGAECRANCQLARCGDGVLDPGEQCDGTNLAGATCVSQGYNPGTLACGATCQLDYSGCDGRCGDGIVNTSHEQCDGTNFNGLTCQTLTAPRPFYDGNLQCSADCQQVVTTGCHGWCGDGHKNGPEECDASDLGGWTCGAFGFYAGTPTCDTSCQVSSASCSEECGDGVRNGPEVCDQSDLGGLSCQSYGWHGGSLGCESDCGGVDTSGCADYCGDGVLNGDELCDGSAQQPGKTCAAFGAAGGGALGCNAFCQPTTDTCLQGQWVQAASFGGENLRSVWASGPSDAWAVGALGTMLHYDGHEWTRYSASPTTSFLNAVWGRAADDVWAVGDGGTIVHYDGTSWSLVTSPVTAASLQDVWASGPNDAWIVGDDGNSPISQGLLLRYDGTSWSVAGSPTTDDLAAVWGSGASDVWILPASGSTAYHYGGVSWSPSDLEYPGAFGDIWGTASDNVWILDMGGYVQHFDGSAWTGSAGPVMPGSGWALWGSSADDVWASGDGELAHYDGSSWSGFPSPISGWLMGLGGSGPADVWAVSISGAMIHFGGRPWQSVSLEASTPNLNVYDVWGSGPDDIWAVGDTGVFWHYDGSAWAEASTTAPQGLVGVWGSGASDVWAVGEMGTVMHYDGTGWSQVTQSLTTSLLLDVWGSGPDDVWFVSHNGDVLRWTSASGWSLERSGAGWPLSVIWGADSSDIWFGGDGETLHYDGSSLTAVGAVSGVYVKAIWGSGPDDVWAVGGGDQVYHFDGSTWSQVPADVGQDAWYGLWGSGPADVWAAGEGGGIYRFDGTMWSTVRRGGQTLNAIWGSGTGDVWAVGMSATAFHLDHPMPTLWGGPCARPLAIYCESQVTGSTVGGPTAFTRFDCAAADTPGPEVIYRLESPVSGAITVQLTPSSHNLDLIVTGADPVTGACAVSGTSCIGASQEAGQTLDQVTFDAVQGETYYLVVDGADVSPSGYLLSVSCTKML